VVITIPKGSYVPQFEDRNHRAPPTSLAPSAPATPQATFPWLKASGILVIAGLAVAGGLFWRYRSAVLPTPRLVPLTSYPELEEQPSLSPDGSQVVFRWKAHIYVKQVGTEDVLQVTRDPAVDSWPAWSPDGSQIAFVRNGDVFLVSPLGGAERKVAESSGRVAWMPDGLALLILRNMSAFGAQSVFRVSLATGQSQRLTFPRDIRRCGYGSVTRWPDACVLPYPD
jgi:hypothetical protein